MAGAGILLDEDFGLNDRYRVVLRAFQVPVSRKFPHGVKAKFVLIEVSTKLTRLLVDNHEPYVFGEVERILKDERR